ncbi:nuclear factor, interleukin 3 regulated, member 3 [Engraulis encrasicolus]|uniref:nuclear factor, interleukin 3 regulated, member 3 n=1 Tax=Engraulis encrasicolus TaxID=184585 RepID=UPI002FD16870
MTGAASQMVPPVGMGDQSSSSSVLREVEGHSSSTSPLNRGALESSGGEAGGEGEGPLSFTDEAVSILTSSSMLVRSLLGRSSGLKRSRGDAASSFAADSPGRTDDASSGPNSPNNNNGLRRKREFIPDERKDDSYWDKRKKNNEAAKRSREKRRVNDVVLEGRVMALLEENARLRAELLALKFRFGLVKDPCDVVHVHVASPALPVQNTTTITPPAAAAAHGQMPGATAAAGSQRYYPHHYPPTAGPTMPPQHHHHQQHHPHHPHPAALPPTHAPPQGGVATAYLGSTARGGAGGRGGGGDSSSSTSEDSGFSTPGSSSGSVGSPVFFDHTSAADATAKVASPRGDGIVAADERGYEPQPQVCPPVSSGVGGEVLGGGHCLGDQQARRDGASSSGSEGELIKSLPHKLRFKTAGAVEGSETPPMQGESWQQGPPSSSPPISSSSLSSSSAPLRDSTGREQPRGHYIYGSSESHTIWQPHHHHQPQHHQHPQPPQLCTSPAGYHHHHGPPQQRQTMEHQQHQHQHHQQQQQQGDNSALRSQLSSLTEEVAQLKKLLSQGLLSKLS